MGRAERWSGRRVRRRPRLDPERRFERLFERLAFPGFGRMGRYDLLVTLGRLGLYELRADSLRLSGVGGLSSSDLTTLAAKRLFAIGDPMLLERRAAALAEAIAVPVEALDLALANWASPPRATLGFPPRDLRAQECSNAPTTRWGCERQKSRPHAPPTVSAVSRFPSARESPCHSASSSPRTPFA